MLANHKSVFGLFLALVFAVIACDAASLLAAPVWIVGGNEYGYRQEITVSSTLTASDLTDYPLLVQVSSPANPVFANAVDGTDIIFTAADGVTQLSRDIETFTTGGTPQLNAWVKTDISSSLDTKIYMYYDGPSEANSTDTWDSNYAMVQHLQEDPSGTLFDSTLNGNNGTNNGTVSALGRIGAALDFDGSDTVNVGNDSTLRPTSLTLEAWAKSDTVASHNGIFTTNNGAANGINLQTGTTNRFSALVSGTAFTYVGASYTTNPIPHVWNHLAVTHDSGSDENIFYLNGNVIDTDTQNLEYDGSTTNALIGAFYTNGNLKFDGIIDEVRLSDTVRSADWIAAQFDLVNTPGAFVSFGAQEQPPVPEPSSFLLLGLGALGLVRHTRRRRQFATKTSLSQVSTDRSSEMMKTRETNSPMWAHALAVVVALGTMLFANLSAHAVLIGSSASYPAISAKQILDYGASVGDGVYWIDPDGTGGNAPFQAYADMTTDDGGWTLMAYAGTIPTTKTALAGANNWFPVFNNFGTYDANSLTSGTAFSHRDMVDTLFQDSSQILSYRSSNLNNQMIFPVANRTSWLGGILPNISFLTLTNDGSTYVTHPGSQISVFNQFALPYYTGYDWNVTGNNSDGYGSYTTALNHRSLLYWERLDSSAYDQQWFHGTPLSMAGALGPVNDFQDIAFFIREDVTYTPPVPEPSSLLLLGLGAIGLVRHTRRRTRRLGRKA